MKSLPREKIWGAAQSVHAALPGTWTKPEGTSVYFKLFRQSTRAMRLGTGYFEITALIEPGTMAVEGEVLARVSGKGEARFLAELPALKSQLVKMGFALEEDGPAQFRFSKAIPKVGRMAMECLALDDALSSWMGADLSGVQTGETADAAPSGDPTWDRAMSVETGLPPEWKPNVFLSRRFTDARLGKEGRVDLLATFGVGYYPFALEGTLVADIATGKTAGFKADTSTLKAALARMQFDWSEHERENRFERTISPNKAADMAGDCRALEDLITAWLKGEKQIGPPPKVLPVGLALDPALPAPPKLKPSKEVKEAQKDLAKATREFDANYALGYLAWKILDLDYRAARLLNIFVKSNGLTAKELAKEMGCGEARVKQWLGPMEVARLVTRQVRGRETRYYLTVSDEAIRAAAKFTEKKTLDNQMSLSAAILAMQEKRGESKKPPPWLT